MLDLKLEPPCADIGLLDYHRKEEIIDRAYHYALPLLQKFVAQSNAQSQARVQQGAGSGSAALEEAAGTRRNCKNSRLQNFWPKGMGTSMPQMLLGDSFRSGASKPMWSDALSVTPEEQKRLLLPTALGGGEGGTKPLTHAKATKALTHKASIDLLSETFARESKVEVKRAVRNLEGRRVGKGRAGGRAGGREGGREGGSLRGRENIARNDIVVVMLTFALSPRSSLSHSPFVLSFGCQSTSCHEL
jgi:hypothetical protein